LTAKLFEDLLIADWHAVLRDQWVKLGRVGGSSLAE
jgi:hypothetical protein